MWRRLDAGRRADIVYSSDVVAYGAGPSRWDLEALDITYEQRRVGWVIVRSYTQTPQAIIGHMEIEAGLQDNGLGKAAHVAVQLGLKYGYHLLSSLPRVPAGESIWQSLTAMGLADMTDMTDMGGEPAVDRPTTSYTMHTLSRAQA
jgi:hypothetical protein